LFTKTRQNRFIYIERLSSFQVRQNYLPKHMCSLTTVRAIVMQDVRERIDRFNMWNIWPKQNSIISLRHFVAMRSTFYCTQWVSSRFFYNRIFRTPSLAPEHQFHYFSFVQYFRQLFFCCSLFGPFRNFRTTHPFGWLFTRWSSTRIHKINA